MTNGGQRPDASRFRIETEMDLLYGRAHLNPMREGCPPVDLLVQLSRRELPIDDPAYQHFAKCSPCYQELRVLQQTEAGTVAATTTRRRTMLVAAVLVTAVAGAWFVLGRKGDRGGPTTSGDVAVQTARLDLRPFAVTRSDERATEPPALELPRGLVNVTVLLPVGAGPGEYEVEILDRNQQPRATATGTAAIREFVTTLDARLDLIALGPGDYKLAVRREGAGRRLYPVIVR